MLHSGPTCERRHESGGEVADQGQLSGPGFTVAVGDVQKLSDPFGDSLLVRIRAAQKVAEMRLAKQGVVVVPEEGGLGLAPKAPFTLPKPPSVPLGHWLDAASASGEAAAFTAAFASASSRGGCVAP